MAKKSAKSKGYRRQTTKKPYLSKRDIALLCALVAALAVAAFFLFRYDDGALKVQNGSVVADGDNWLIVDGSNTRGRSRYFKLGEMGEIDGYARETGSISTDANVPQYVFTPEGEGSGVTSITVTSSHSSAEALAKYAAAMLGSMDNTEVGEVQTTQLGDRSATYFIYNTAYTVAGEAEAADGAEAEAQTEAPAEAEAQTEAPAEAEAEAETEASAEAETETQAEAEPNRFSKVLSGYVNATHDSCIAVHVESEADAADACPSDEALVALLEQAVSAVTLEAAEK